MSSDDASTASTGQGTPSQHRGFLRRLDMYDLAVESTLALHAASGDVDNSVSEDEGGGMGEGEGEEAYADVSGSATPAAFTETETPVTTESELIVDAPGPFSIVPAVPHIRGRAALLASGKKRPFKESCLRLLDLFCKKDEYMFFHAPVDVSYVPEYPNVIKNPMDFGTMRSKVLADDYDALADFKDDIQLIVDNCRRFNPPDSIYCKSANTVWKFAEKTLTREAPLIATPLSIAGTTSAFSRDGTPAEDTPPFELEPVVEYTASGRRKVQRRELGTIPRWLDGVCPNSSIDPEFTVVPSDLECETWEPPAVMRLAEELLATVLMPPHIDHPTITKRKAGHLDYGPFTRPDGTTASVVPQLMHAGGISYRADIKDPIQDMAGGVGGVGDGISRAQYLEAVWHGDPVVEAYVRSIHSFLDTCPAWLQKREMARVDTMVGGSYSALVAAQERLRAG